MNNNQNSSWHQYERLVISELDRHDKRLNSFDKDLIDVKLLQARTTLELVNIQQKKQTKSYVKWFIGTAVVGILCFLCYNHE